MKINSFTADGVHDYLKFDIEFYSDLTFLIGINGSGKTSALKLILGLTSPSFQYLNSINYKYCEVICSSTESEKNIIIRSEQNELDRTFLITLTQNNVVLTSEPIKRFFRNDHSQYDADDISQLEQRHKEIFDEFEIVKKIRELTTPKFLGLDRRIYEGLNIDHKYRNRRLYNQVKYRARGSDSSPEPQAIDSSLEEVQALIFDNVRQIPKQQLQISDDFKHKMFSRSFNFVEDYNFEQIPSAQKIVERKQNVLKAIESLGFDYLKGAVNSFFSKIEDIAHENETLKAEQAELKLSSTNNALSEKLFQKEVDTLRKWYNNGNQLKRIDDIIRYSQDYQEKIAELRAPFKKMENLISNFLKEGNKTLSIEADGEIKVLLKNGKTSNVFSLSSGEKQIIIMIAHLIFEEAQKKAGIFIIDEPELSLHIAWQEIFVQSIMEASPQTQFILATHSPSIVAKVNKEKHCQDLNKYNK